MTKYLFRIDDIHPKMDWENFNRLKDLFSNYQIKPILSVIPDNGNESLNREKEKLNFWESMRIFETRGWTLAMHGYQHRYINKEAGILNINKRSEFAGLSYQEQFEKIKRGKEILVSKGIKTNIFVAPAHSLDRITVSVLKKLGFSYISDGIGLWPFKKENIIWIPQIVSLPRKLPFGLITFCLHPQSLSEKHFQQIKAFINKNKEQIVDFDWILEWLQNQSKNKINIFNLVNSVFKPIWYLRLNLFKIKKIFSSI